MSFHYDIGINNPIISIIYQIIDDSQFKGIRFKNIVKSNKKYIGVTAKIIENISCIYIWKGLVVFLL